jgi:ribosomal protein L13
VLRGKHKTTFAPHIDTGDHVIIVNADKIVMTKGKADKGRSYRYSGYPGGLKSETYADLLDRKPADAIRLSVRGMLPKGPLGRQQIKKLKVYAGPSTRTPPRTLSSSRSPRPRPAEPAEDRPIMATKPLTQTTGRRKEAVARARLRPGTGTTRSTVVRSTPTSPRPCSA